MPELKEFINKKILKSVAIVLIGQRLEMEHLDFEYDLKVEENDSGKISTLFFKYED